MKKLSLLFGLALIATSAFSQELNFTKGDRAPGKLENGRAYEEFIDGKITITDKEGNGYSFVKADFNLVNANGKKVQFIVDKVWFNEEQSKSIVQADDAGTVYTFSNIVVKNSSGKEFMLPEVRFEFPPNK